MKLRVDRDVLAEAVTWTARSVPARPPPPPPPGGGPAPFLPPDKRPPQPAPERAQGRQSARI